VEVAEGCYGKSACAGVVAWAITSDAALLTPPEPTATPALAFSVTAGAQAVTLTGLGSAAPASALSVSISGRVGTNPFAAGAIGANTTNWTALYSGSWTGAPVTFNTPLALAAGQVAALVVSVTSGNNATLACANALGAPGAQLMSDGALSVSQGGALAAAFAGAVAVPGAACAWDGVALSYTLSAACAPPPPAVPLIATARPTATAASLDDLLRALADSAVGTILINAHIALNGTELDAALGAGGTRTLVIEGTNACERLNGATPLCSLSAGGASRVLGVTTGVYLTISQLLLRDGVAPAGQFGGCVVADCANCSLALMSVHMRNCSAADAAGGALAVVGGGGLTAQQLELDMNTAAVGGGLLASGGTVLLNNSVFRRNIATGAAEDVSPAVTSLSDLPGSAGGGVALIGVRATISGCTFSSNIAKTSGYVLLSNPDVEQARAGALFASESALNVSGTTFNNNTAFYGGAVYLDYITASFAACAFVGNLASLGDGGALFASDCDGVVSLSDSLLSGNAAGGHMGGAMAAFNATMTVLRSVLTANSAPHGCGGAVGLDAGAELTLGAGTVVSANTALNGGGLCCSECDAMETADSFLYNNAATAAGGAIHSSWSPTTVLNSSLTHNSAPEGGAIAAVSSPLNVTDCTLVANEATATHGGAIFHNAEDDALQSLVLTRSSLTNNTCHAAGGAVAAFWSASAVITACNFTNNSITAAAPTGGGVMSLNVASLVIQDCFFTSNWVVMVNELTQNALLGYVGAVAAPGTGSGGALWVGADEPMAASVLNTISSHNFAVTGGGIYATGAVMLTMRGSTFMHDHAYGISSEGGGLLTDMTAAVDVYDTWFYSCEAVRGGAGWHGGASQTNYTNCLFEENEAVVGDDTKGSTLYSEASSRVVVTQSRFVNNFGHGLCEGTVAMARSDSNFLSIADSLFDGNSARFGGCIMTAAHVQRDQLHLAGVTFRNNYAYVGGVLYSEADEFAGLECPTCDTQLNNTASDWGQSVATPAKTISITLPSLVRSGAPMPNEVTLTDGCVARCVRCLARRAAWPDL
jgi:hypothetical protein